MAVLLAEAVAQLRERITAGASRIAIQAPPGFGKTTLLNALAVELAKSRRVVRVEFPEGDDAALVALVDAATQLGFAIPDLLDRVVPRHEPARVAWAVRLAAVREALNRAGRDIVLLVDEPRFEDASSPGGELFAGRAVEITETLLSAQSAAVVLVGASIPHGIAANAGVRLPLVLDQGGALAGEIEKALGQPSSYRPRSPVVVQILRALRRAGVDIGGIPARDLRLDRLVTHDLGRIFLESAEMRQVMARLAVLRVPFSMDLLERAGLTALPRPSRQVVEELLGTLDDGAYVVPAALAHAIRVQIAVKDPAWTPDEPDEAHRFAAAYHRERYEGARQIEDVAAAIRAEMEEIYQLTKAGDASALLTRSLQFVEQYDALGRSLSQKALRAPRDQEEKLRRDAVRAYERAIEHDGEDAYAHHYIAYNLDIMAVDPVRVERAYVIARDLDRKHAWYHSRYICFLITTAWVNEAHAAWERALADLSETVGTLGPVDYEELHAKVARLLLDRSQLDFAAEVLEDVPDELRTAPWWSALDQLRVCLEEDRDERLVFPPSLPLTKRWNGPHLSDEREVHAWKPGRVLGRDEQVVLVNVAEGEDELSTLNLHASELADEWNVSPSRLRAGAFIELIHYKDGSKEIKLWDRKSSTFDEMPYLPKLFPSPDRYIRHAFA